MRRCCAWCVRQSLGLIAAYLACCWIVMIGLTIDHVNQIIDYGLSTDYAFLDVAVFPVLGCGATLALLASRFLWTRRRRWASALSGVPRTTAEAPQTLDGEGPPRRKVCSVGRFLICTAVVGLLAGGFVLNRRSRAYNRLSSYHSLSTTGHRCGERIRSGHAAYHDRLHRMYFRLARMPWLLDSDEPAHPECPRGPTSPDF